MALLNRCGFGQTVCAGQFSEGFRHGQGSLEIGDIHRSSWAPSFLSPNGVDKAKLIAPSCGGGVREKERLKAFSSLGFLFARRWLLSAKPSSHALFPRNHYISLVSQSSEMLPSTVVKAAPSTLGAGRWYRSRERLLSQEMQEYFKSELEISFFFLEMN